MAEVLRLQDEVTHVRGEALTEDHVRRAIRDGIAEAVADPRVWSAAVEAMKTHAQQEAGGWLLGNLRTFFGKLLLFVVLGMAVYMTGGWSALVAYFKTAPTP